MKPGGGRRKGHDFERFVAARLRELFPNAKRGLQGRDGGDAPDVEIPGWWIECKCGEPAKYPLKALEQAERDALPAHAAGEQRVPVAVCRQDRKAPTVTMRLVGLMSAAGYGWVKGDENFVVDSTPVTIDFDEWLALVRAQEARR